MIAFRVTASGNLELSLQSAGMRVREAVRTGVQRAGVLVLQRVKQKLSGEVLRTRTGRLRRSVSQLMRETPGRIETQVGTNVEYAAPHEYGIDKVVQVTSHQVRAHLRTIQQAFGRAITPREVQVGPYTVGAHAMHMRLPERSFLRSALEELRPQIETDLRQRVAAALQGGV